MTKDYKSQLDTWAKCSIILCVYHIALFSRYSQGNEAGQLIYYQRIQQLQSIKTLLKTIK